MTSITAGLPINPSAFSGYVHYTALRNYQSAERLAVAIVRTLAILTFIAIATLWFFWIPYSDKWEIGNLIFVIVLVAIPAAIIGAVLMMIPNGIMRRVKRENKEAMLSHLVATICQTVDPGDWRWFELRNANNSVFFTRGLVGIINLEADRILYLLPQQIRDFRLESRNIGATTKTNSSAITIGGYGENFLGAYTTGTSTASTQQHYTHVVDLYTTIQGANHIPLYFGPDEAYAKEAYGRLTAMTA
jgi:hypothetical protein